MKNKEFDITNREHNVADRKAAKEAESKSNFKLLILALLIITLVLSAPCRRVLL
jgi:hypothetical protein